MTIDKDSIVEASEKRLEMNLEFSNKKMHHTRGSVMQLDQDIVPLSR